MDFKTDSVNTPCCSNSLKMNESSSKIINNKNLNDPVIIDSDASNDSAYDTGSALSRSPSLSSVTCDNKLSHKTETSDSKHRVKLYLYANINCDHNFPGPWQRVLHIKKCGAKTIVNNEETIVISDSDEEDVSQTSPDNAEKLLKNGRIVPLISAKCEIISLNSDNNDDDDDDDDEEKDETIDYYLVRCKDGTVKKIPDHCVADVAHPELKRQIRVQTRVIARRNQGMMPSGLVKNTFKILYSNDDRAFYPGITSSHVYFENGSWHQLIFFDDGHSQYVSNENIRVVFGKYSKKYVHPNAQEFHDYYFKGVLKDALIELVCREEQKLRVFLQGEFKMATVVEYDRNKPGLVLLEFNNRTYGEWLYTGSPRIEAVWSSIVKNEKLKKYRQANTTLIEVSSDSEEEEEEEEEEDEPQSLHKDESSEKHAVKPSKQIVVCKPYKLNKMYKPPIKFDRKHICSNVCVKEFEENDHIFEFDPLKRPILAGWKRNVSGLCYYNAPCGRPFRTIETIYRYLKTTESKLTIDCFSFSIYIDCMTEVITVSTPENMNYLNNLIPGGFRERQPIPVVSINRNTPIFEEYVTRYRRNPKSKKVPAFLSEDTNPFLSSCDCVDDCSDRSKCSCWQLTQNNSDRDIGYKYKRLENRIRTGIYECNHNCECSSSCLNRVVKNQVEQKLELFETKNCGYGIRCQTDLPKGTFVACYFGDILHGKTADERAMKKKGSIYGDEYFMQLDHIEVAEQFKDGYESDVEWPEEDIQTPQKRPKLDDTLRRTPRNDLNKSTISYFPNILKKRDQYEENERTNLFGKDAVEFVVDGRYRGNISRFFNHSCEPNLFSQTVFVDTHDLRFPWLAFFTSFDIKAGTELTWDYSYQIGSIEGREMECKCGARTCRKRLL